MRRFLFYPFFFVAGCISFKKEVIGAAVLHLFFFSVKVLHPSLRRSSWEEAGGDTRLYGCSKMSFLVLHLSRVFVDRVAFSSYYFGSTFWIGTIREPFFFFSYVDTPPSFFFFLSTRSTGCSAGGWCASSTVCSPPGLFFSFQAIVFFFFFLCVFLLHFFSILATLTTTS